MSDSENEYEALVRRNLERKKELLAELGLDNLLKESRHLFEEIQERNKPRTVRRKSALEDKPARRSVRIQKRSYEVKYVNGFRGFDDYEGQESSADCEQSDGEPSVQLSSQGRNYQKRKNQTIVRFPWHSKFATRPKHAAQDNDQENECMDHEEEHKESNVQENKNENSDLNAEEELIKDQKASSVKVDNMNKIVPDQKTEIEECDNPDKNVCGTRNQPEMCEISVENNGDFLSEKKDISSQKEKMRTVDKTYNFNINNNNDNENVAENQDYQSTEWNERSEEACKHIILNYYKKSIQFKTDEDTDSEDDWSKYKNVMFCISASEDSDDSIEDNEVPRSQPRSRRRQSFYSGNVPSLSCEDVTEEMITNIAKNSSRKEYDQKNGTTCHQCRQKTLDTKTVCRSGRCGGVRGMFCGICLPKRYGEQVADALKNPEWECPVCRGICNCSFCRARAGKNPTGIMYPEARQQGYNCVAEYLKDKENDKENIRTKEKKYKVLKN